MNIILATHNQHKVEEVKKILKDINIISLEDLKDNDEVLETGHTFSENAFLKASYYFEKYQQPVIADDSGLVVAELNGAPGIHSARYANDPSYLNNNLLLLENMKGIIDRQAYFITVICYIDKYKNSHFFEARLNGTIDYELRGNNSFGYDPLFKIEHLNKTLGEIPNDAKNLLSHRFLALQQLINHIKKEAN